ncbi:MAG: outer membrane protein assembly factor [Flavobacteriaceae bacterium]|nr:outer membrane protein assembly factor [Flavobacteriaceae bacterium]
MRLVVVFFCLFFSAQIIGQERVVKQVIIKGNTKTKAAVLTSFLLTKANTYLDSVVLHKDIKRLKELPAVSYANYHVIQVQAQQYHVVFKIEENRTLIPSVSIWTTTNKKFAYKVGLYDYNFLGRNITLGGFYQNNGYHSYGINFSAPFLFSNKLGLAVNHQNWVSEEPLYFDSGSANYKYQNIALETLLLYQLNFKNKLAFGVNFFKEKYNYVSGTTSPSIPQELDINKTMFKFVYGYNNLTYHYQYIDGFKNELYTQMITSKNNFQDEFFVAWNDFFYFRRLWKKGNWANRLRIGLSTNNKSPFAPFALDNNVNLRGVGILVDRGTGSIVYNTEYRHTLLEKGSYVLQSNVFLDAGTWRKPGGEFSDFTKSENQKVFSGLGLRIINKKVFNAIFRIDYGVELTNGKSKGLVFGIGQYF